MKTKWDKIQKEPLKKDNKQVAKIASPKNKPNQGLGSYKSEKDLNRKLIKPEQKMQSSYDFSESNQSIILEDPENKKNLKQLSIILKQEGKPINLLKNLNEVISPKGQTAKFLKSKNTDAVKEEDKIAKLLQEKNQQLKDLQRKNEDLQTKVQILLKEKQKANEILLQFKNEKQFMQKNLEKLKNVALQNRKLLRQKAQGFNSSSVQIKNLRDQIQELTLSKKSSCLSQIGVNTSIQEQKLSQTAYEQKENISSQMQSSNIEINNQNQLKIQENEQESSLMNLLNGINFEQNLKFSMAANLFSKIIKQQTKTIQERETTIYELQKQLNQLYEKKQSLDILKPKLQTSQQMLLQVKENQDLRESLLRNEKKCFETRLELWNKERELQNLKREVQVKDIFYQAEINSRNKLMEHKIQASTNDGDLKKQIQELNRKLFQQKHIITQLLNKNSQQDLIIKSLKQKKVKIIK